MALSVNLTLVVQIFHFFIAYCIITHLFLKPGYNLLAAHTNRVKQIKSRIIARQELIAHKQNYKYTRWQLFKDFFYKQKPHVRPDFAGASATPPLQENRATLSEQDLKVLAETIARSLSKELLS